MFCVYRNLHLELRSRGENEQRQDEGHVNEISSVTDDNLGGDTDDDNGRRLKVSQQRFEFFGEDPMHQIDDDEESGKMKNGCGRQQTMQENKEQLLTLRQEQGKIRKGKGEDNQVRGFKTCSSKPQGKKKEKKKKMPGIQNTEEQTKVQQHNKISIKNIKCDECDNG